MTQLPDAANAVVDDAKITGYLLNPTHSISAAGKANFFLARGFSRQDWQELKRALLDHPQNNPVTDTTVTRFGEIYEVSCTLVTPDGRNPCVVSVWIVEPPNPNPRFVTAYPNPP
jgi:hypothetical protein